MLAGQTLQATVYGVDSFFNTDTTDNTDKIWVSLSSDTYAAKPASQTLVSGTTVFTLVPVTATQAKWSVRPPPCRSAPYVTSTFIVNPDTATAASQRLQLVLSGETAIAGLPPYGINNGGKTGSPQDQYAGVVSTVAVRLVDRFYNLITSGLAMTTAKVHTDDPSVSDSNIALVNGVAIASVTYLTQNNGFSATTNPARNQKGWVLTTTDQGVTNYIQDVSTYTKVWPGPVVKLRVLTASQAALEGSSPAGAGKTNPSSPGSATAGVAFPVIINAVDANWNTNVGQAPQFTANTGDQVYLQTNDAFIQNDSTTSMINGQLLTAFAAFTPRTAQTNWTFSAVDVTNGSISSQTVTGVNVSAASGGAKHFQVILPGENALPGSGQYPANGKTGTPSVQTAGSAIPTVTVNLVDDFWNPIKSGPALPYVGISPSAGTGTLDQYAVIPSSKVMTNPGGTGYSAVFASTMILTTAGSALSHQIQAADVSTIPAYSTENSSFFTVNPNSLAILQVLMPGELAAPGKPLNWSFPGDLAGKTGAPSAPVTAGQLPITVTVNAVDSYYNPISTNAVANITTDDPYGTPNNVMPLTKALTAGSTTFSVTFLSAQDQNAVPITHFIRSTWTLTGDQSPDFAMTAAAPTKTQILLPNETPDPGNLADGGKTGTPTAAIAGENYPIAVRITDNWFNAVGNASQSAQIHLVTADPFAPSIADQFDQRRCLQFLNHLLYL